jgi:hypothetical protein
MRPWYEFQNPVPYHLWQPSLQGYPVLQPGQIDAVWILQFKLNKRNFSIRRILPPEDRIIMVCPEILS